jgi:hypothetical protein
MSESTSNASSISVDVENSDDRARVEAKTPRSTRLRRTSTSLGVVLVVGLCSGWALLSNAVDVVDHAALRASSAKAFKDGNFKVALDGYRKLALAGNNSKTEVPNDLGRAVECLRQLGRQAEFDELVESAVEAQGKNWRLLEKAANEYRRASHNGFLVAGKFERGPRRGQAKRAQSFFRDRGRALQLLEAARLLTVDEPNKQAVANLYYAYAEMLLTRTGYREAWRLQSLTDLKELPDIEEHLGWWWYQPRNARAPVDAGGTPIYHQEPASFEQANTDGERWRWLLAEVPRLNPSRKLEIRNRFADFMREQLGVQTMGHFGWWRRNSNDAGQKNESGTYALHTLSNDETIARTAVGIKRLTLPDEFNFMHIYQSIAETGKSSQGRHAREQLCSVYENRRQYPTAAKSWRTTILEYGKGNNNNRQRRLDQIVDNWGRFEPGHTQSKGQGAVIDYRFRNGDSVEFEAYPIKVELLLNDLKTYLKSNPSKIDYNKTNIGSLGYRLIQQGESKYIDKRVASWKVKLKPRANHVDDRITVTTPLSDSGAYLVCRQDEGRQRKPHRAVG